MAITFLTNEIDPAAVPGSRCVGQLSFTARWAGEGTNLWSPRVSGWREQCSIGRKYGREAIDYIRETGDAAMLTGLVRAIAERGTFGGVEAGFFSELASELIR